MNAEIRRLTALAAAGITCGCAGFWLGRECRSISDVFRLYPVVHAAEAPTETLPSVVGTMIPAIGGTETIGGVSKSRVSEIMKLGYPGFDNLRTFEDFVVSYDRRSRTAHWVFEHLTPERLQYSPNVDRSKCQFKEDDSVHPYFRSRNDDYKGSGYDRGHLAAAGNHRKSQSAVEQTFFLSNMAPQVGKGFNRDKWNDLEKHVRALARKYRNVYVCTGPLYLPRREPDGKFYIKYEVIGRSNVAVPTHFFKVIAAEDASGKFDLEAYVLPNMPIADTTPLSSFAVPLESIERAAGFLLFDRLPRSAVRTLNGRR